MSIAARPRLAQYLEGYNGTGVAIGKYLFVTGTPAGVKLPAAITDPVLGATAEDIAIGDRGNVQALGIAVVTAGEAISQAALDAGARVYAGTDGKAYLFDAAAGVNQSVAGIPLSPAAGDGKLIEVLLHAGGIGQGA